MEETYNQLITTAIGLCVLGGAYVLDLIVGSIKVLFTNGMKWNWKKAGEDLVKAILIAISTEAWVLLWNIFILYTSKIGVDITPVASGISIAGMAGAVIIGAGWYLANAYKNIVGFVNTKHIEVKVDESKTDWAGVVKMVEQVCATFIKHEPENVEEYGAGCYYDAPHDNPDQFVQSVLGKGFDEGCGYQCVAGFKEFQFCVAGYTAPCGGSAKGYASEPYRSGVCAMGFTWHNGKDGIRNGDWAIFGDGQYGHVAMYYNGQFLGQNQGASDIYKGNPFNLMRLGMNGIVGYFRPNIWGGDTPTPTPTPEPQDGYIYYTYQKGDSFGKVLQKLGLMGRWDSEIVAYYTNQLAEQGVLDSKGNIPIGTTIKLKKR